MLYLAADPATTLAEVRGIFVNDTILRVSDPGPWTLVTVAGLLDRVLDLSDADVQNALASTALELSSDSRAALLESRLPPTHVLAMAAFAEGDIVALRYPSAQHPGGTCIAVFADRLLAGGASYLEVIDPHGLLDQRLPPA